MKEYFHLGKYEITWLSGGRFELDGGAMFGVVPKVLWSKRYPGDEENFVPLDAHPILVRTPGAIILIETGLGNKLTEKQKKIFRLREEWNILEDLQALGITREDIDFVILTHYDFDHSGGVVMIDEKGKQRLTFPKAKHVIQKREWEDVLNPNKRSLNTFWPINFELLKDNTCLELVEGDAVVVDGVDVLYTGGHNRGHQIVRLESKGNVAYHLGDLLPTHAHFNPLWITAYDNFPLESIHQKENLENRAIQGNSWFIFYHDPLVSACKFDEKGNVIDKWEG